MGLLELPDHVGDLVAGQLSPHDCLAVHVACGRAWEPARKQLAALKYAKRWHAKTRSAAKPGPAMPAPGQITLTRRTLQGA